MIFYREPMKLYHLYLKFKKMKKYIVIYGKNTSNKKYYCVIHFFKDFNKQKLQTKYYSSTNSIRFSWNSY